MKLKELCESTNQVGYHVTYTENVPNIKKEGLKPLQSSNWVNGTGDRYNESGGIFSFENPKDAFKWAWRMILDNNKDVSIIKIDLGDEWHTDPSQDPQLTGGEGRALRSDAAIKPTNIIGVFDVSDFGTLMDHKISLDEWYQKAADALNNL